MLMITQSYSHIVLGLLSPSHYIPGHLVELIMFVMQVLILKLQVLKFFILSTTIAFEQIGQVVDSFADLLVQLLELCLGCLLQLF